MKNTTVSEKPTIKIESIQNRTSKTFKAGKYIVIDLCYIYPDEHWSDYVEEDFEGTNGCGKDIAGAVLNFNGIDIFTCSTKYGDGGYPLYKNNRLINSDLSVDSGMLSLVPLELAESWPQFEENKIWGEIVSCNQDFQVSVFGDKKRPGNWRFLDYEVITSDEECDNED